MNIYLNFNSFQVKQIVDSDNIVYFLSLSSKKNVGNAYILVRSCVLLINSAFDTQVMIARRL